jgi:hypothetical protein
MEWKNPKKDAEIRNTSSILYYNYIYEGKIIEFITRDILIINLTTNPLKADTTSPINCSSQNTDFSLDSSCTSRNLAK